MLNQSGIAEQSIEITSGESFNLSISPCRTCCLFPLLHTGKKTLFKPCCESAWTESFSGVKWSIWESNQIFKFYFLCPLWLGIIPVLPAGKAVCEQQHTIYTTQWVTAMAFSSPPQFNDASVATLLSLWVMRFSLGKRQTVNTQAQCTTVASLHLSPSLFLSISLFSFSSLSHFLLLPPPVCLSLSQSFLKDLFSAQLD